MNYKEVLNEGMQFFAGKSFSILELEVALEVSDLDWSSIGSLDLNKEEDVKVFNELCRIVYYYSMEDENGKRVYDWAWALERYIDDKNEEVDEDEDEELPIQKKDITFENFEDRFYEVSFYVV